MSDSEAEPESRGLASEQTQALLRAGTGRQVPPDTYLFREGEATDRIFVLESGRLELRKGIGGQSTRLLSVGAGSVLALVPALDEIPCPISACTTEPSRIIEVRRHALLAALSSDHEGSVELATTLAVRAIRALRRSTDELALAIYEAMRSPTRAPQEQAAELARVQAGIHAWPAA